MPFLVAVGEEGPQAVAGPEEGRLNVRRGNVQDLEA